jgi:peroxiredoxin
MPDWMGKDISDFSLTKLDGNKFTLSQHKGKDVVVVFWATWCIYCVHEIPHLNALIKDIPSSELAVIAISDESAEKVKSFSQSKGIEYDTAVSKPNFSDLPAPFNSVYRQGRPAAAFIDKQGKIKLMTIGKMNLTEMKQILKAETVSSN